MCIPRTNFEVYVAFPSVPWPPPQKRFRQPQVEMPRHSFIVPPPEVHQNKRVSLRKCHIFFLRSLDLGLFTVFRVCFLLQSDFPPANSRDDA